MIPLDALTPAQRRMATEATSAMEDLVLVFEYVDGTKRHYRGDDPDLDSNIAHAIAPDETITLIYPDERYAGGPNGYTAAPFAVAIMRDGVQLSYSHLEERMQQAVDDHVAQLAPILWIGRGHGPLAACSLEKARDLAAQRGRGLGDAPAGYIWQVETWPDPFDRRVQFVAVHLEGGHDGD